MIPKIIHYCWFGKNKMPKLLIDCINTWKRLLPDFEFILWDDDKLNFDNEFVKYAYDNKKWAYVSDYIRLKALYDFGGVYLDTDMYLIKPIDANLLENECFFGVENDETISCGIIGAVPNQKFIGKCLQYYNELAVFNYSIFKTPITQIITKKFRTEYSFHQIFTANIKLDSITIYKVDYFYPYPFNIYIKHNKKFIQFATDNTYAIHLWAGSWHDFDEFYHFRRKEYFKGLKKMTHNIIKDKITSKSYFIKVFVSLKKSIKN